MSPRIMRAVINTAQQMPTPKRAGKVKKSNWPKFKPQSRVSKKTTINVLEQMFLKPMDTKNTPVPKFIGAYNDAAISGQPPTDMLKKQIATTETKANPTATPPIVSLFDDLSNKQGKQAIKNYVEHHTKEAKGFVKEFLHTKKEAKKKKEEAPNPIKFLHDNFDKAKNVLENVMQELFVIGMR